MPFIKFHIKRFSLWLFIAYLGLYPQVGFTTPADFLEERWLSEVFDEIEQKYQVFFNYEAELVQDIKVEFTLKSTESLEEAIERLLMNTHLRYEQFNKKYVVIYRDDRKSRKNVTKIKRRIRQINNLERKGSIELSRFSDDPQIELDKTRKVSDAQKLKTIQGTIASGEVLIGASVRAKGTSFGTLSNEQGYFSLRVPQHVKTLVITYVGYKEQEITVRGNKAISINMEENFSLNPINIVGSRNENRSATDSPAAVDIIDVANIAETSGKVEINQILQFAAPSFNATKQSGSDGADHIDPASLRGLGPDQTLVLVNGKRRHQSSLVNVFGTRGRGNTGTDLNAIPASAIKRIEVLRDGASAQYGSDAIAGVINIVLKRKTEGLQGGMSYGAYSTQVGEDYHENFQGPIFNIMGRKRIDGEEKSFDGNTRKLALNYGLDIGSNGGFANVTTEYISRERTLRPGFSWRKGYGTAEVEGINFFLNSAIPLNKNTEFYAFGGHNYRNTDAYAFSRNSFGEGDNRSVPSLYPKGFTPRITSDISDISISTGVRHSFPSGWRLDVNNTYGKNKLHYHILGSNNASLGAASPTDFDAGGHSLSMNTTGLDLSKYYQQFAAGFNLAMGLEYRTENFQIFPGEEASYATYDQEGQAITNPNLQTPAVDTRGNPLPRGAQGFPGYSPDNAVDQNRSNLSVYFDSELNITDAFLLGGAIRYESYSDFGKTFNFKFVSRYKINENFALRGSTSSGFRAPSLAQVHYSLLLNNIVVGRSVSTLIAANTSQIAKEFGIKQLQEETAINKSLGLTFKRGNFSATIDAYSIDVQDRIILTDNFDAQSLVSNAESARFFANGVDTETRGLDLILNYRFLWDEGNNRLKLGLAGNMNKLKILEIKHGDLDAISFFSPFSQAYLTAAAPDYKIALQTAFSTPRFSIQANLTQFSAVLLQDYRWVYSPPTTAEEIEDLYKIARDFYHAALTLDLSLGFNINSNIQFTLGANNLLNTYPTPQFDGWTDQGGFSDSVQMGADGAYYFGRIGFKI